MWGPWMLRQRLSHPRYLLHSGAPVIASPGKVGSPWYRLSPQLMSWEAREREPQTLETKINVSGMRGGAAWAEWRGTQQAPLPRAQLHCPRGSTLPRFPLRELRPTWWESTEAVVATPDLGCPPWGVGGAGKGAHLLLQHLRLLYSALIRFHLTKRLAKQLRKILLCTWVQGVSMCKCVGIYVCYT